MEHLSLEIFDLEGKGSKYAALPDDTIITITDTSEIFASGDVWSYSFTLNICANAHIFGTSGDIHGTRLHDLIDKRRARLWVEGLPLYLGYIKLDDEVDVDKDGNVDVTFESGQKTFDNLIESAKANQVPMMSPVLIGMALWRKRWVDFGMKLNCSLRFNTGKTSQGTLRHNISPSVIGDIDEEITPVIGDGEQTPIQEYPRMVFPKGIFSDYLTGNLREIDCINTDYPYDEGHPYCNVALCYQRYGYEKTNDNGDVVMDYSSEPEAQRGYELMPANRVNSAPNFFVIYWIRALMKHIGIHIDENQMMNVEDLRRLFFVNTRCEYKEPERLRTNPIDWSYGKYTFNSDGRLVPEYFGEVDSRGEWWSGAKTLIKPTECGFTVNDFRIDNIHYDTTGLDASDIAQIEAKIAAMTVEKISVTPAGVAGISDDAMEYYLRYNSLLHEAYADSKCFPDVEVSEVIDALKNGFGIRFLFNDNYQRVRIVLLRNVFRSNEVQEINCDILSCTKSENNVRGFKMTYGGSEDTHFYYKGFADKLPHKSTLWPDTSDDHDYSHWDLNAEYADIMHKVTAFNKTCYVTPNNGNAYIVKVDKNAKRYDELHPSLFECAPFMDAEDGDCSGDDETIDTVTVGFKPAIMNDLNWEKERNENLREQKFALFVDETMRVRRPDLMDGTDYNDPDAVYKVDSDPTAESGADKGLYGKDSNVTGMRGDDGIVKPGEFAITSDMYASVNDITSPTVTVIPYLHTPFGGSPVMKYVNVSYDVRFSIEGHVNEGYRLYLQDNFDPNDDGVSPLENHEWGITLGIMRGSGSDASVSYDGDPDDGEGNDTWEIEPGSSVTTHPDTCDVYGNLWAYNGNTTTYNTASEAINAMRQMWPDSNFDLINRTSEDYLEWVMTYNVSDDEGVNHTLLLAWATKEDVIMPAGEVYSYARSILKGKSVEQMFAADAANMNILIEADSSRERGSTLEALQALAFNNGRAVTIDTDNGLGVTEGRFSLKLRAEKPNPNFDPSREESADNRRYLQITDENLRRRGLCDQFYREYSFWVRNARIAKITVKMEVAQLLSIDKTVRVDFGDIVGFIRKIQYSVSMKTGMSEVTMEIMYI